MWPTHLLSPEGLQPWRPEYCAALKLRCTERVDSCWPEGWPEDLSAYSMDGLQQGDASVPPPVCWVSDCTSLQL